eukprot:Gb_05841 [translate_table: standard]
MEEIKSSEQAAVDYPPAVVVIQGDDNVQEAMKNGEAFELAGYCGVTLVKHIGLLVQGDPSVGVVRIENCLYTFSSEDALKEFVEAPFQVLRTVEGVACTMPQLINILQLHKQPLFHNLAIPEVYVAQFFD